MSCLGAIGMFTQISNAKYPVAILTTYKMARCHRPRFPHPHSARQRSIGEHHLQNLYCRSSAELLWKNYRVLVKSIVEASEEGRIRERCGHPEPVMIGALTQLCGNFAMVHRQKGWEIGLKNLHGTCFGQDFGPLEQQDLHGQAIRLTAAFAFFQICS